MPTRTIQNNQLTPNVTVLVQGRVTYSHIASLIEGKELEADIRRKKEQNRIPITKPYTQISIKDARILYLDPTGKTKLPEEIYIEESFYTSNKPGNTGMNYTAYNKWTRLPQVAQQDAQNPTIFRQIRPEGELAANLLVTLELRTFKSKSYANSSNVGISLDRVIANEPIQYYRAVNDQGLQARGLTFIPMADADVPPAPTEEAPADYGEITPPEYGDPYTNMPPVQPVPMPQVAPVPPVQTSYGPAVIENPNPFNEAMPAPAPVPTPAPLPPGNMYAPQQTAQMPQVPGANPGGIVYDANKGY